MAKNSCSPTEKTNGESHVRHVMVLSSSTIVSLYFCMCPLTLFDKYALKYPVGHISLQLVINDSLL